MDPFTGDSAVCPAASTSGMAQAPLQLTVPWWEWQDDLKRWTPFLPDDRTTIEQLYRASGGQPMETTDLSWNRNFGTVYCFDFQVMAQTNQDSKKKRLLRRREVPCCPAMHMMEKMSGAGPWEITCGVCGYSIAQREESYHCSSGCGYRRCLSCQGERLEIRSFTSLGDWQKHFTSLSRRQVRALRQDVSVRAQLEREGMQVVWRQWLDTERTFGSEDGKTTTDLTLFAMGPEELRDPLGHGDADFVNFPAIRSPNYCDEVDVVGNADGIMFDVKNRHGELLRGITLRQFMEQLGQFIPDLEPTAAWSDPVDNTLLQTSSQFSIIPAPSGRADVGIAAFGHQCTNLHVVIGPTGDLGWAAEHPGAQRIFFRDASGKRNHAISLVPEKRQEVSDAFFKLETHDETVEEERQRYEKVQNRLVHLQITMDGVACSPTQRSEAGRGNVCPSGHSLAVFLTPHNGYVCDMCDKEMPARSKMFGCRPCDFDHCVECWRKCAQKGLPEPSAPQQHALSNPFGLSGFAQGGKALSSPLAPGWSPTTTTGAGKGLASKGSAPAGGSIAACSLAAPLAARRAGGARGGLGAAGSAPPPTLGCASGPPPAAAAPAPALSLGSSAPPFYFAPEKKRWRERGSESLACEGFSAPPLASPPAPPPPPREEDGNFLRRSRLVHKEKKDTKAKKDKGEKREKLRSASRSWSPLEGSFGALPTSPVGGSGGDLLGLAKRERRSKEDDPEEDDTSIESGLLLAVVERGAEVGPAVAHQMVPRDARRKPGVAVRVTYLHYGLAADGCLSAERTRRFVQQANFKRRELQLPHGSLVSGLGSWGGPENAPIKLFGFRLMDAMDGRRSLQVIEGVSAVAMPGSLDAACQSLRGVVPDVLRAAAHAEKAAKALALHGARATLHELAALYLYTMAHSFYRKLNAAMRDEDRSQATPFFGYLRLLFSGLQALARSGGGARPAGRPERLWRGVHLDLHADHEVGCEVTWWGASSCTPKLSVAKGFLGCSGARTLFSVTHQTAVPIKEYSAFRGEEEWLLAPGTRLRVESRSKEDGVWKIQLTEQDPPRDVR